MKRLYRLGRQQIEEFPALINDCTVVLGRKSLVCIKLVNRSEAFSVFVAYQAQPTVRIQPALDIFVRTDSQQPNDVAQLHSNQAEVTSQVVLETLADARFPVFCESAEAIGPRYALTQTADYRVSLICGSLGRAAAPSHDGNGFVKFRAFVIKVIHCRGRSLYSSES
ncbi:MAG: hypothetical protein U1E51_00325 [Candidatus Binatia bacterium]|nr:hypothetical protein [Candidatus Binatia bacterium]